jgi:putative two-component system response regulator
MPYPDNITKTILIVKEQPAHQQMIQTLLEEAGYDCLVASDGFQALRLLEKVSCTLLISDVHMSKMDGVELLATVRRLYPHLAVIMQSEPLSAKNPQETIAKHKSKELLRQIKKTLDRRERDTSTREQPSHQPKQDRRTRELELVRKESMAILSRAAEFRDNETAQHNIRIGLYCELLATRTGLSSEHCKLILQASPLHDVGKIGIPDKVLLKPGRLTKREFTIIKTHCEIGCRILADTKSEVFQLGKIIAASHHEKYDGSGYPNGLREESIPLEGRITAICDVFDALTSKRIYKEAMTTEKALDIMQEKRGRHFDPQLLDIFLNNIEEILEIRKKYQDQLPRKILLQDKRGDKQIVTLSEAI